MKYLFSAVLLLLSTVAACGFRDFVSTEEYIPVTLSPPDRQCQSLQSWQGLLPGQSTRRDVTDALGRPDRTGRQGGQESYEYAQTTATGDDLLAHRVFFQDDRVDRFEVVVADVEGRFYTVGEMALELGKELDVVFLEGGGDVYGPAHVYVWAECGVALIAIPLETVLSLDEFSPQLATAGNIQLEIRHPVPSQAFISMEPDVRHIVMVKVLFPPCSYESFKEAYWWKMPYESGRWNEFYLRLKDK